MTIRPLWELHDDNNFQADAMRREAEELASLEAKQQQMEEELAWLELKRRRLLQLIGAGPEPGEATDG